MYKRFIIMLALILLLAGCKADPTIPAADPTLTTILPTEAATLPTEAATVPATAPIPAETEPPTTAATEPEETTVAEDTASQASYKLTIDKAGCPVYSGPGYDYSSRGKIQNKGVYTIVEEAEDSKGSLWGKLKSGLGWINLTDLESPNTEAEDSGLPYKQTINKYDLSVYPGPGYDYVSCGTIRTKGVYTIVEEAEDTEGNLWGKLKSGLGWVDLTRIRSENYQNALMSANYADENLVLHGAYDHYSTNREFCTSIAFRAYGELRNVTLFEMDYQADGPFPGADLYTLPEMTEEMPLVAELDFPGDMSMYGIRFEDEDGKTHTYHIYISLRNGDLMFEKA